MIKVKIEISILYTETAIRNGNADTILAKVAPAPTATNNAGNAQHKSVEDDAMRANKLAGLSFIIATYHTLNGYDI
jgi:hypothetical protein